MDCPIPDISNSIISNVNVIKIGEQLGVTCEENYVISDASTITCVSGSVFSKELPVCQGECVLLKIIDSFFVFVLFLKNWSSNTMVQR